MILIRIREMYWGHSGIGIKKGADLFKIFAPFLMFDGWPDLNRMFSTYRLNAYRIRIKSRIMMIMAPTER